MKNFLFILAILLFANYSTAQVELTNGLKPAPTEKTCGCKYLTAYKVTKSGQKPGTVIVYSDLLIFQFGTSYKQFYATQVPQVWKDDNGAIYLMEKLGDGKWRMVVKTTIYGIVIQDGIGF